MNNTWRIWRSPQSDFAAEPADEVHEETCQAHTVYTDEALSEIAANGFNGIWVHALLHHIVSAEPFPELGKSCRMHREALEILIRRAKKYGIRVFLYLQPPRAIPLTEKDFWRRHADCGGVFYPRYQARSLCVSEKSVCEWLRNVSAGLAETLPELGGLILITASELPSHCYSHRNKFESAYMIDCPRCREREPQDIVIDVIQAVRDGVRRISSDLPIIVWNWSWTMWGLKPPCREIVERLPHDVVLMADFERGGYKDFWKRPRCMINEYALSYDGPSGYCRDIMSLARSRGMRVMAKLQFGTTHELATVVSLPVMSHIFSKALFLRDTPCDGYLGCWNFGNFFSANTVGFNFFLRDDTPPEEDSALKLFAEHYFPGCDSGKVASAWKKFSQAMFYYPFSNLFLYNGPMNYTLAYREMYTPGPLRGTPCGPSHLSAERGDELASSFERDGFTAREIYERLERLARSWEDGLADFEQGLASLSSLPARREFGNAVICGCIWESTASTYRVYELRRNWNSSLQEKFLQIARDEIRNLQRALPWVAADKRQGWHAEAHACLFDEKGIQEKIRYLEHLIGIEEIRQPPSHRLGMKLKSF